MDLSHAHHLRYSSCVIWKDPPSPNPAGVAETGWRTALSSIHCCEAKSAAAASAAFEKMTLKFTRRFPCWTSALLPVCPSHQFILGDSPRLTDTRHLHPGNWVKKWAVQDFLFFSSSWEISASTLPRLPPFLPKPRSGSDTTPVCTSPHWYLHTASSRGSALTGQTHCSSSSSSSGGKGFKTPNKGRQLTRNN